MHCNEIYRGGAIKVGDIPHPSEQQFFLLLHKRLPRAKIVYERSVFKIIHDDGKSDETLPDFFLEPSRVKRTIIEITLAPLNGNGKDPKKRQKEIMENFSEDTKFVVLYREHLLNIRKHNPEFDFFNARLIRKDEPTVESSMHI